MKPLSEMEFSMKFPEDLRHFGTNVEVRVFHRQVSGLQFIISSHYKEIKSKIKALFYI